MDSNGTIWGIHMGAHVGDRPVEEGYVAIGWRKLGNPLDIGADREAYKQALSRAYPEKKAGAIPVDAGTIYKFIHDIRPGDLVVYPSKSDRMVNIGRFIC